MNSSNSKSSARMLWFMAGDTQGNQVLLVVIASVTSKLNVMYLKSLHGSARLAAPSVALKYLPLQIPVRNWIELDARPHDAVGTIRSRKACFCEAGRNK